MHRILLCLAVFVRSEKVTVSTSRGDIIGDRQNGYDTFFGVPYAMVDEKNRFGKTIPYPFFNASFIANDSSIMCPQVNYPVGGILQCLRLNIYVPHTENKKRAVLVWFHGGSFSFGSGGEYGGQHLAKQGIIVITVNFRLGPYGFFCAQEGTVPGNQALRDQIDALKWVQKEIKEFGGDPNSVTIAGEGYGGGFVDLHLYSEYETLFDKAIIQSGSIFARGFYVKARPRTVVEVAKALGRSVGSRTKPRDVLKFLNKIQPLVLMNTTRNMNLHLGVCKEKYNKRGLKNFVIHDPFHFTKFGRIKSTKILIGYNSMDLLYAYADKNSSELYEPLGDIFHLRLMRSFSMKKRDMEQLSKIIKDFYLGGKSIGPESMLELVDSGSDFYVNHAVERSVTRYIKAEATVFKYLFSYTGGSQYKHIKGSGASHEEEVKYLFEWKNPIEGPEQEMIRHVMTSMWANFVKFGNPTPNDRPISWTPVLGSSRSYLDIDVNLAVRENVYNKRMAFWDLVWLCYQKNAMIYEG